MLFCNCIFTVQFNICIFPRCRNHEYLLGVRTPEESIYKLVITLCLPQMVCFVVVISSFYVSIETIYGSNLHNLNLKDNDAKVAYHDLLMLTERSIGNY